VLSVRQAALIAGIALGVAALAPIVATLGGMGPGRPWQSGVLTPVNWLFRALPPALLLLLYRSGAALSISTAMKRLAMLVALLQGAALIHTVFLGWSETSRAHTWLWHVDNLLSQLAIVLFLVALIWHERDADGKSEPGRWFGLREVAALTAILWAGALLWGIGQRVYADVDLWKHGMAWHDLFPPRLVLEYAFSPLVCWMLTAYIIYRSVPAQTPEAVAE